MYVVFDIETTGLDATNCDIVQFAYILFDSQNVAVRAESLYFYYDGMHWDQAVADKTHQFSLSELQVHAQEFRKNCIRMFTVLNEATVIGHNSNHFDVPFVTKWLSKFGFPYLKPERCEDTMICMRPLTKRSRIKLMSLAELCGYDDKIVTAMGQVWFGDAFGASAAHNAMFDVAATSLITLKAIEQQYLNMSGAAMPEKATAGVRIPIDRVSKEWLDQHHVHYVRLRQEDGYSYIGTCDAMEQFKPETYSSLDSVPQAALDRLLPVTLTHYDGVWMYEHGDVKIILQVFDDSSRLHMTIGLAVFVSDDTPYDTFVQVASAVCGTPLTQ